MRRKLPNLSSYRRQLSVLLTLSILIQSLPAVAQGSISSSINNQTIVSVPPDLSGPVVNLATQAIRLNKATPFMRKIVADDLSLVTQYNYLLSGNLVGREVPDGWYRLTVAAFRLDPEESLQPTKLSDRFLTAGPPLFVEIRGGVLPGTTIPLEFRDTAATATLSLMLIELIPLKADCNGRPCIVENREGKPDPRQSKLIIADRFRPLLVQMDFLPYQAMRSVDPDADALKGERNPLQDNQTLEQFVLRKRAARSRLRPTRLTPADYAAGNRMHYLSFNDQTLMHASSNWFKKPTVAAEMIHNLLSEPGVGQLNLSEKYKVLMPALCEVLAAKNEQYRKLVQNPPPGLFTRCGRYPEQMLQISRVIHVGEINRRLPLKRIFNPQQTLTLAANSVKSRSRSYDSSYGLGLNFGISGTPFSLSSLGLGVDHKVSVTYSRTRIQQGASSLTEQMDFLPLGLSIPTYGSVACLQVSPMPTRSPYFDTTPNAKNSLYICDSPQEDAYVNEVYAHAYSYGRDGSWVQAFSPGSQTVNREMRGAMEVKGLFWAVEGALKAEDTSVSMPGQFLEKAPQFFQLTSRSLPYLVVSPMAFDQENDNSVYRRVIGSYTETFID